MDFNKPGPNKRVCAFLIDSIIAQLIGGVLSFVIRIDVTWIMWSIIILFKDCYNGQSAGKFFVDTQVIDENNLPAKSSQAIIRNIFLMIPIFPLIEYCIMLRDKENGKRIGDTVAKTRVTDLKPQVQDGTYL